MEAHSVQENKHSHIFLTNQSPVTFKFLDNLAKQKSPPMDINSLTMKAIEKFMLEQFHPKRFVVRERYKFWAEMRWKPEETIQDLTARIRQDAVTCDFSSITNPQDEAMRTRFICSCENEAVLKALFKTKMMTFPSQEPLRLPHKSRMRQNAPRKLCMVPVQVAPK